MSLIQERSARISPTPTLPAVSRAAFRLIARHTNPGRIHHIAELGCGWGGILIRLSRLFPKAELTGYEMAFWPRLVSRARTLLHRDQIRVIGPDFFKENLDHFDLVYCYLSPRHMRELIPQLRAMKSGTFIVSNAFAIPDWTPVAVEHTRGMIKIPVYLYCRA